MGSLIQIHSGMDVLRCFTKSAQHTNFVHEAISPWTRADLFDCKNVKTGYHSKMNLLNHHASTWTPGINTTTNLMMSTSLLCHNTLNDNPLQKVVQCPITQ